jgi:excisionase family DNA binding protein
MRGNGHADAIATRRQTLDALFADTLDFSPAMPSLYPAGRAEVAGAPFPVPILTDDAPSDRSSQGIRLRVAPGAPTDGRHVAWQEGHADSRTLRLEVVVEAAPTAEAPATPAPAPPRAKPCVLTTAEAADLLRVSVATMRHLVRTQRVPCARVGRQLRFRRSALLNWLANRERDARSA